MLLFTTKYKHLKWIAIYGRLHHAINYCFPDAKNFQNLANVFNVPEYEIRHYFTILYHMLQNEGGIEGLKVIYFHQTVIK